MARVIFIIRHGEKPGSTTPPYGVDVNGVGCSASLIPTGWQRAGALTTLFDPERGGLAAPTELIAPSYDDPDEHRTHQTILPLSLRTTVAIQCPYSEGEEAALGAYACANDTDIMLICWEHHAIPTIAQHIAPIFVGAIPTTWPDDRFDVVWCFVFNAGAKAYGFSEIPQLLLAGDSPTTNAS